MTAQPPSRIPWPPILMAATLVAGHFIDGMGGEAFAVLRGAGWAGPLGAAILLGAVALDLWCFVTLSRLDTTILPHRAASSLATQGPYRYSRNPIYIAHVCAVFGLALLLRSTGAAMLTPVLVYALVKLAIEPEERHLSQQFPEAFGVYQANTRRWF